MVPNCLMKTEGCEHCQHRQAPTSQDINISYTPCKQWQEGRFGPHSCGLLLLLAFHLAHESLCLIILAGHDVAHAQVGQDNGRYAQQQLQLALHQRLVELGGLFEPAICHNKCNVKGMVSEVCWVAAYDQAAGLLCTSALQRLAASLHLPSVLAMARCKVLTLKRWMVHSADCRAALSVAACSSPATWTNIFP